MIISRLKNSVFITFILMLLSFGAFAQNQGYSQSNNDELNSIEGLYEVKTMDDVGLDLGKRFILATLGKDALVYFLPNGSELESQIRGLTDAELERFSRPFNSQLISGTLIMVSIAFLVAFVTILIYIIWIYMESIMRTQESGSFLGDDWSKYFTPVKIVVGCMLIYPVMGKSHEPFKSINSINGGGGIGSFSIAQFIILKTAGISNDEGNKIYGEYIRTTPVFYPSVKFPNATSKSQHTQDLLNFMICAKLTHQTAESGVNLVRTSDDFGVYRLDVNAGRCNLKAEVGFDTETIDIINNNKDISSIYSAKAYEDRQKELITKAFQDMLNKAGLIADKLIYGFNKNSWIAVPNTYDHENWSVGCGEIENHIYERSSKTDLILLYNSASKCLSKQFVDTLTASSKPLDFIYSNQNKLDNGYMELCSNDFGDSNKRTAVVYNNFDNSLMTNKRDLKGCIQSTCQAGNILECSSAIGLASQLEDRTKMAQQGWMTAGANAYTLFKTLNSSFGRGILNRSSIIFETNFLSSKGSFKNTSDVKSIDKISLDFPMQLMGDGADNISTIGQAGFLIMMETISDEFEDAVSTVKYAAKNTTNGGADGWFGTKKFQHCIENPQEVSGGFVCGNITEEMHQLGSKLIALGIQLKSISLLAKSYGVKKKESKKDGEGKISAKAAKKGVVKKALTMSFKIFDSAAPVALVGWFLYETGVGNDAFTDFNDEVFKQYPEIIAFVAGAGVVGVSVSDAMFISNVLDIAVNILIPLGILFAFILPLIPLAFSMIVVAGFIVQLFIGLLLSNVWGVVLITPSRDHSSSASLESTKIIVSMFLKAPLSVAGLIIAWTLNNTLISEIMVFADIGEALAFKSNDMLRNFIDQFVILIVYFLIVYGLYNIIFSLIEGFHEIAIDTLFSGRSVSPFANKARGDDWKAAMDQTKNISSK